MSRRGTSNSNVRGNTRDREARKRYLLQAYEADIGGGYCRCYRCGCILTFGSVTVDRIIPSARGGKYVRNNIRPACAGCNMATANAAKES